MTVEITAENPRSIRAIEVAAGARQWLKCRTADGAKAYGISSQRHAGVYHLVTCSSCTCEDARRHLGTACKHQLAVRLHCELAKAQRAKRRQPAASKFTREEVVFAF